MKYSEHTNKQVINHLISNCISLYGKERFSEYECSEFLDREKELEEEILKRMEGNKQ